MKADEEKSSRRLSFSTAVKDGWPEVREKPPSPMPRLRSTRLHTYVFQCQCSIADTLQRVISAILRKPLIAQACAGLRRPYANFAQDSDCALARYSVT